MLRLPAIHAVIVGIDKYPGRELRTPVGDVRRIEAYLRQIEVPDPEKKNIYPLTDEKATKENIMNQISSISEKAKRNEPILFYFSGYAGRTEVDGNMEGVLCPVDVDDKGGISNSSFLQQFDDVAKSCGNNITVILDCSSNNFSWVNPASLVVVAPDTAKETEEGGAFTTAVLSVLKDNSISKKTMTVEAFAGHVEAAMNGVAVRAFGVNVNRKFFDLKGEKGHHVFVPCRTLPDGRIVLCAGAAQGVRVDAIYGVYPSNIKSVDFTVERLGSLRIASLHDNGNQAVFDDMRLKFDLPNFFYAVEEDLYFDPISIYIERQDHLSDLAGWIYCESKRDAVITAKSTDSQLTLTWNGFADQPDLKAPEPGFDFIYSTDAKDRIQRRIRRAARFHSLVGAPPPDFSSIANRIKVRLHLPEEPKGNILENDKFEAKKLVTISMKEDDILGPYSLTIENRTGHPVWPYAFICDPQDYTIYTWYAPPPGLLRAPVQEGEDFVIGGGDSQMTVNFSAHVEKARDYTYLKIFVTKERMEFSALEQWYTSPTEDALRKIPADTTPPATFDSSSIITSPGREKEQLFRNRRKNSPWASLRIAILQTYTSGSE